MVERKEARADIVGVNPSKKFSRHGAAGAGSSGGGILAAAARDITPTTIL
jgi:hypothetical protein